MLRKPTFRDQLAYRIDNLMAWNPAVKVIVLFLITASLVIVSALLASLVDTEETAGALIERGWTNITDPASPTEITSGFGKAVSYTTAIGGLIFFALLIGLISDGLGGRMDALAKGTTRVIASGHTVILGWSDKTIPLLRELMLANENTGGVIAILAERDKQEMETEIAGAIRDFRRTRIVCRTGSASSLTDLEKVAADRARSVVVLAAEDDEDTDATAVRSVLALRRALPALSGHVVVEIASPESRRLLEKLGGGKVEPVLTHDVIGRFMIQSARQPGLAHVFEHLLGYAGDELYLKPLPALVGKTFGQASRSLTGAIACGLRLPDGSIAINPSDATRIEAGHEVLVLATDDDSYSVGAEVAITAGALPTWTPPPARAERVLFCGWRNDIDQMVLELDGYVGAESEVVILATRSIEEREEQLSAVGGKLSNVTVRHVVGEPSRRAVLVEAGLERFDSIIVLVDESAGAESGSAADSRNLVALLIIRDLLDVAGREDTVLISEIRDPATKLLVSVARLSDFVVSSEILSKYLAQIAERQDMAKVWRDLLDASGNEIYLKDARFYADVGERLSFHEVSARARLRGEIALGYGPSGKPHVINPVDKTSLREWGAGDIVVAISPSDH